MSRFIKYGPVGIVVLIFLLNACSGSLPSTNVKGASNYHKRLALVTGGFQRSYPLYVPLAYNGSTSLPLVVVIIYMVDFSNGGMMAYRFAAENSDMLAAVAPIAASIGGRPYARTPEYCIPKPKKPLPILIIHGLDDDDVSFGGGASKHRKGGRICPPNLKLSIPHRLGQPACLSLSEWMG